jgi:CRP/FNR family cyclic AMP-dependent transcriptional regulator
MNASPPGPGTDQFTEPASPGDASAGRAGTAPDPVLLALISEQPFLKGLNVSQLQLLTESALVLQFETDQSILEEGTDANRFYIILSGKVALESALDPHGAKLLIQTLGPGDVVGWSWLFPPYAIHFGARAVEPTKTIFFYGTRLREQCEQDHELGYQLMKRIAEVATQCLQASQQAFTAQIAGKI